MNEDLSVENITEMIRQFHSISNKKLILPSTFIQKDLVITGDDGSELLAHLEKVFSIQFKLSDFDLKEGEYLFQSEGFSLAPSIHRLLTGESDAAKDISVGNLHKAIMLALNRG